MRLLADENVPVPLIEALAALGHDVASVLLDSPGADDRPVLHQSNIDARILLTLDLDFGELTFRERLPGRSGVILLRIPTHSLQLFLQLSLAALQSRSDWEEHFSVIEPGRIRMTPMPS